jgi:hypothetical protein
MLVKKNGMGRWIIDFTCKGRRIARTVGPSQREAKGLATDLRPPEYGGD